MTFTPTDYSNICAAIASGEMVVQYNGKRVEFRSIAELQRAKTAIAAELIATGQMTAPDSGGIQRGSTTFASYCPE